MAEKGNKNLHMPDWIIEILDKEVELAGDSKKKKALLGDIAAAAIYHFSRLKPVEKGIVLGEYQMKVSTRIYESKIFEPVPENSDFEGFRQGVSTELKRKPRNKCHEDPKVG